MELAMTADELKARIQKLHPQTEVQVTDLTGTMDHWQVVVISPVFEGKLSFERQKMIMALLKEEIASNEVHALTMKTYSPSQYQAMQNIQ
jgi:acid stress-induced BolA-like protein IbaG/YrbA